MSMASNLRAMETNIVGQRLVLSTFIHWALVNIKLLHGMCICFKDFGLLLWDSLGVSAKPKSGTKKVTRQARRERRLNVPKVI